MNREVMAEKVRTLILPLVEELRYELYHVEYVKENDENYLRIYIDSPDGISLSDCEKVSRPVSDLLDEKDPISDSYYLEVSSPGVYRYLHTDKHLDRYIGSEVLVKLKTSVEGKKVIKGKLEHHTDSEIIILEENKQINVPKEKIKSVNLEGEL